MLISLAIAGPNESMIKYPNTYLISSYTYLENVI